MLTQMDTELRLIVGKWGCNDKRKTIPCSVLLNGEYNQNDLCIGVPCIIGKNGVEEIIELDLNNDEMNKFNQSADAVRSMNSTLSDHT